METLSNFFRRAIIKLSSFASIHLTTSYDHALNNYRQNLFDKIGINRAIDVGANKGGYSLSLLHSGFQGKILSFEPLKDAYDILVAQSKKFNNWEVYKRGALGNINGEIEINVSENLSSSSIYNVMESSTSINPKSGFVKKEKINISRLEDILQVDAQDKMHLKIDVQGYEKEVISGAINILSSILTMELEISMVPLYQEGVLADELLTEVKTLGYTGVSFRPAFVDQRNGRILQLDGLFIKNDLLHLVN